ncbi:MAG TPA: hypothetical protein VGK99_06305 [Acidobacteriota bacterium]
MKPKEIDKAPGKIRTTEKPIIHLTDPKAIAVIRGWFNGPLETENYKIVYAADPDKIQKNKPPSTQRAPRLKMDPTKLRRASDPNY